MNFTEALKDISLAFKNYYLWVTLGWYDVLARYRRSTLGPIWITLSMIVTIVAMGPLYGTLFGFPLRDFIPHLSLGMIIWSFISVSMNEFCLAFVESQHYLKQVKIPFSIFILRVMYRQFIIFCHNFVIFPIILIILWKPLNINALYFVPAFILLFINMFWMGIIVSIFCTRYRDMIPVVSSVMQLLFFVTPIIWTLEQLPENRRFLASWNFLGVLLDTVRQPLLGIAPSLYHWAVAVLLAIVGSIIAFFILARVRHRITYWL